MISFFAAQYVPDKLDEFIDTINSKLQPMFMQIRKGMSEENGQQYYALVSLFNFSTGPVLKALHSVHLCTAQLKKENKRNAVTKVLKFSKLNCIIKQCFKQTVSILKVQ